MSDFADDFRDSLAADFLDVFGGEGSYTRGVTTVTVTALESSEARVLDDNAGGFSVERTVVFFRIMADALGELGTPRKGDRYTVNGVIHEVLPEAGEPEWTYSSSNRSEIVFRTKVVS